MSDNSSSVSWPGGPESSPPAWEPPQWTAPGILPTPPPAPGREVPPAQTAMPSFRSWQPGIVALRPLPFGDFLAVPFKAFNFNRAVVLGGPLVFTLIATVVTVAAVWVAFQDPGLDLMSAVPALQAPNPETVVLIILAVVASLLADILSTAIIAPGVARANLGERISFGQAWSTVISRFWHVVALYLLTVVIWLVVLAPLIGLFIAVSATGSEAAAVLMFLLVLPVGMAAGLVVTLYTAVARPIVVLEKVSAVTALKRSWTLMKGRFWWSVLIVFVTGVLIYTVSSVLQFGGQIAGSVGLALAPTDLTTGIAVFGIVYGIAYTITYTIMYAYMGSVFTLIYTDLRMRHEGFHLDLARAAEARANGA